MRVEKVPNHNVLRTLKEMKRLAIEYHQDIAEFAGMPITEFFEKVKEIPYKFDLKDGKLAEIVKRPYYTMNQIGPGGDCDDIAIVFGAYAVCNGLDFRFKVVGKKLSGNYHHTYTEIKLHGKWVPVDATYPHNSFGKVMGNYRRDFTYG